MHERVPVKLDNGKACILRSSAKLMKDGSGKSGDVFDIIVNPNTVETIVHSSDKASEIEEIHKV